MNKDSYNEFIVKCTLHKSLLVPSINDDIQNLVEHISKIINKASLVLNKFLLYCLSNNLPLPDLTNQSLYIQCATIGTGTLRKPVPYLWQRNVVKNITPFL